ncbi:hypothetical protein SESBI_21783 [Sesbania bispinosa]|nr:hypothetical protein SESBI_21783 [Sesbania bispinosa]
MGQRTSWPKSLNGNNPRKRRPLMKGDQKHTQTLRSLSLLSARVYKIEKRGKQRGVAHGGGRPQVKGRGQRCMHAQWSCSGHLCPRGVNDGGHCRGATTALLVAARTTASGARLAAFHGEKVKDDDRAVVARSGGDGREQQCCCEEAAVAAR